MCCGLQQPSCSPVASGQQPGQQLADSSVGCGLKRCLMQQLLCMLLFILCSAWCLMNVMPGWLLHQLDK
jgi:hypothetical protein